VDAPTIVHTNNVKIWEIDDNNNNIMSIASIPPANNPNPLVLSDTLVDDNTNKNNNKLSNNNKSSNNHSLQGDNLETQEEIGVDAPEENPTEGQDQGVHRSRCKQKGTTGKYADYGLMMNAPWQARGSQHQATIPDSLMFFSVEDLSNAKPVAEEDQEEWALGVACVHYSMRAGIKKFREKGKAGVTKERSPKYMSWTYSNQSQGNRRARRREQRNLHLSCS
jgi:hypothetical protein